MSNGASERQAGGQGGPSPPSGSRPSTIRSSIRSNRVRSRLLEWLVLLPMAMATVASLRLATKLVGNINVWGQTHRLCTAAVKPAM